MTTRPKDTILTAQVTEMYDPLIYPPPRGVPDADGARFRWLCEDHSDRETRERCRSLIDRLPVMSYSDAVMSIDAAMVGGMP